jgi:hypothetical protein
MLEAVIASYAKPEGAVVVPRPAACWSLHTSPKDRGT